MLIKNVNWIAVACGNSTVEVSYKNILPAKLTGLVAVENLDVDKWLLVPLIRNLVKNI